MAGGAKDAGRLKKAALPEQVLWDILLRLPRKSLLRFRAVCKAWRRLGSDRVFLREYHLRQPARPLLRVHRTAGDDVESLLLAFLHYCLEAVDLRRSRTGGGGEPSRTIVRFRDTEYMDLVADRGVFDALEVHGSCDGLLLLSYLDAFFVCNPATRRWAPLPALRGRARDVVGFYAHADSGEHRVLYQQRADIGGGGGGERRYSFHVLTVGSQAQRPGRIIVGRRIASSSDSAGEAVVSRGLMRAGAMPPVLLDGSLHWPPVPGWFREDGILVFDTVAEEFSWMRPPMVGNSNFLFETEEGKLALSCCDQNERRVDLWIMQNRERNAWVRKFQIELPAIEVNGVDKGTPRDVTIVSQEGDVLVEFRDMVLHCDSKGKILGTFSSGGPFISFTRHMLKESLVPLPRPFLTMPPGGGVDEPPFFRGL
ncbi:unnamed protein product [Urochloa humidicola]